MKHILDSKSLTLGRIKSESVNVEAKKVIPVRRESTTDVFRLGCKTACANNQ